MTSITTREDFTEFKNKVDQADFWDDVDPEEWRAACDYAGIDYDKYDDPDELWRDLMRVE